MNISDSDGPLSTNIIIVLTAYEIIKAEKKLDESNIGDWFSFILRFEIWKNRQFIWISFSFNLLVFLSH